MEHAAVHCTNGTVTPDILPAEITGRSLAPDIEGELPLLDEVELCHIRSVFKSTNGNRAAAAAILKISESTLYRRLHLLEKPGYN